MVNSWPLDLTKSKRLEKSKEIYKLQLVKGRIWSGADQIDDDDGRKRSIIFGFLGFLLSINTFSCDFGF